LVAQTDRVQNAGFTGIKLLITYGLNPGLLQFSTAEKVSDISTILSLDALTIS